MRTRRILKWAGTLLLVGLCAFVFGWVPYFLGGIATTRRFQYNDKANRGLTPASFNLPFEEVSFQTADGVPLKGWWVPAPDAKGTVVLEVSGGFSNLALHAPAETQWRIGVSGGANAITINGSTTGALSGDFERQSAGYGPATNRYDIQISGGASHIDFKTG